MALKYIKALLTMASPVAFYLAVALFLPAPQAIYADSNLDPLIGILTEVDDAEIQRDILAGIHAAIDGRRSVAMPKSWAAAYPKLSKSGDEKVRQQSTLLAAIFRDERAVRDLFAAVDDDQQSIAWRMTALTTLVQMRTPKIEPRLRQLASSPGQLRNDAIRALAAFDRPAIPVLLLKQYSSLDRLGKASTINTLCSRPHYAKHLWDAIEQDRVPVDDLSAFAVRQLMALDDDSITTKLEAAWGTLRFTSEDRRKRIDEYKAMLTSSDIGKPDVAAGKLVFSRTCANCHQLFDQGGKIGPNLTGTQRKSLDYLLENLIDPNALIGRDYRMTTIVTEGRIISGLVAAESDTVLTIRTPTDTIKVPVDEIEARKQSAVSMMPEGMLDKLSREEIRDLAAYLASNGPPGTEQPPQKR